MELSDDDVLEILKLFEQSKFDFLQLQHGERKITVSKGGFAVNAGAAASSPPCLPLQLFRRTPSAPHHRRRSRRPPRSPKASCR